MKTPGVLARAIAPNEAKAASPACSPSFFPPKDYVSGLASKGAWKKEASNWFKPPRSPRSALATELQGKRKDTNAHLSLGLS